LVHSLEGGLGLRHLALSPHGADDDPPALSSTTDAAPTVVPKEKPNQASNKTGLLGGSLRPSHGATVVCSFD
jgi:hypothetical protein